MKERPILFSAPMVRAILSGRKTQTRREVKPQPKFDEPEKQNLCDYLFRGAKASTGGSDWPTCPYGQPGDRLWVKETWGTSAGWDSIKPTELPDDQCGATVPIRFAADGVENDGRWRPSIFMRRWMSRITLEIVSVRVERLNEISKEDAIADGIQNKHLDGRMVYEFADGIWDSNPRVAFAGLWEKLNGAGSWAANPWVWVLEFKRVEKEVRNG